MDDFGNRYLLLYQKMASFLGVGPSQIYKQRVLRYFAFGFVLLSFLVLQLFCQLVSPDFSFHSLVFALQFIIPDLCCAAQYISTVIYTSQVDKAFDIIKLDWQRLKNDDEIKIMQRHAYQTVICMIVCGCMNQILVSLFAGSLFLLPMLRSSLASNGAIDNHVFFCIHRILDVERFYYAILTYGIICSITIVSVALGCYSIYFMTLQHICSRLSIIEIELHRPFLTERHDKKPMDLKGWVINISQHLAQVKEFVQLINAVTEKNYLFQMTFSFFLLVIDFLCLLQIPDLLEHEHGGKDILMSLIFVTSNLLPIYLSCLVGQRLIDYSEDIYKEACLIPIYDVSLESQKLLLVTLIMNAKPFAITIGKIFVSSHQYFSDVLRTSLSFSMMVHSLRKK